MATLDEQARQSLEPAVPDRNGRNGEPPEEHARVITIVKGHTYHYLEPRPGSASRQLFCKGRRIKAEVIYSETVGEDPRTPEQVAEDFGLPIEMVHEAIHYCENNQDFLQQEHERSDARIRELGLDKPPHVPADYKPAE